MKNTRMLPDWPLVVLFILLVLVWYLIRTGRWFGQTKTYSSFSPEYLKGLNFLLNEQPDKAIEVFIKMVEVDTDMVETHLALGNLFRQRGEVERAIRIHQNLMVRPNLEHGQRSLALLELGMDYMCAGLLDRAEARFKELADNKDYATQASQQLLAIYQQEKDWERAILVASRLTQYKGQDINHCIAQFYCELACIERDKGDIKAVGRLLCKAFRFDKDCVRATKIKAELAFEQGKIARAIKYYQRIEQQDPEYLPEIIHDLFECYHRIGRLDQYMQYLQRLMERHGSPAPLMLLADLIVEKQGREAAIKLLATGLQQRPTMRGMDKMIEYMLADTSGVIRDNLLIVRDVAQRILKAQPSYYCYRCGFKASLLYWQCPGCKRWNSIKPECGVKGG